MNGGYGPPGHSPYPGSGHGSGFAAPGAAGGGFPSGGFPPGGYPEPPPPRRTDQLAVAGLIFGILGLVGAILNAVSGLFGACCMLCTVGSTVIGIVVLIPSVAALVMGAVSASRIDKRPEELEGKGLAVAALVLGVVSTLGALAEIVLPWLGIACFAASGAAGGP